MPNELINGPVIIVPDGPKIICCAFTSVVPESESVPPAALVMRRLLSRKMPPERTFVPEVLAELTTRLVEVLAVTELIVPEKFCPPVALVRLNVPPRV